MEDPLTDAKDHQQGESMNLDISQGRLPEGRQADELIAVGRRQRRGQVNAFIDGLDEEPDEGAEDIGVVEGQALAGRPPGRHARRARTPAA